MFYELIKKICDKWYQSEDCKIKNMVSLLQAVLIIMLMM